MIVLRKGLGVGAALALVALALVWPRLAQQPVSVEAAAFAEVRAERAVEYARSRLWDDFLAVRQGLPLGSKPPSPSLTEYTRYLLALRLSSPGDVTTLYVVPVDPFWPGFEELRVAYEPSGVVVVLHVALVANGRVTPAGTLRISAGSNGVLGCTSRTAERPQLWSFWPVVPQPLLP